MDSLTLTQDLSEAGQNTTHGEAFQIRLKNQRKNESNVNNAKEYEMEIK